MSFIPPALIGFQEQQVRLQSLSREIHFKQLEQLKKHRETVKVDLDNEELGFADVIDFVVDETGMEKLRDVNVYMTTNKAIRSLDKFVKAEIEGLFSQENRKPDHLEFKILVSQLKSFLGAAGFFSMPSKEIFIVKDIHLFVSQKITRKKTRDKRVGIKIKERKSDKETGWKNIYGYKPKRFNHTDWILAKHRSVFYHELIHFYLDRKTGSNSMWLQEEWAYGHMIGWCRKEGLKDEEIVRGFLIPFGSMLVQKDKPEFQGIMEQPIERKRLFKKEALEESRKLMARYDNIKMVVEVPIQNGDTLTTSEIVKNGITRKKRKIKF